MLPVVSQLYYRWWILDTSFYLVSWTISELFSKTMYAYIHPALLYNIFTTNNNALLNQFTWSPLPQEQFPDVIKEIWKFKNDDYRISRFRKPIYSIDVCSLVHLCWLHKQKQVSPRYLSDTQLDEIYWKKIHIDWLPLGSPVIPCLHII